MFRSKRKPSTPPGDELYRAGVNHAVEGRLELAAAALSSVLVRDPGHAEAHNNLGLVLQRLGRVEESLDCFRRAVTVRPDYVIALTNRGAALAALGRQEEAIACYERALVFAPEDPSTLNNLGVALHATGGTPEAMARFETALALAPDFTDARANLAAALNAAGRREEAITHYAMALETRPLDEDLHVKIAHVFHALDRHADAIAHFRRARDINPSSASAHAGLGQISQETGDIEGARVSFRRAIELDPSDVGAFLSLAHISRLSQDDAALQGVLALSERLEELSDDDRINTHFSLGKALADCGRHAESFEHFIAGNAIKRRYVDYDERRALRALQTMKDVFTAEYLARWPRSAASSEVPVFIVGMPRSGSTLVEQILAQHPRVVCVGETNVLRDTLRLFARDTPDWRFPDAATIPPAEMLQALAELYLQKLEAAAVPLSGGRRATRITNKMLSNFRYLGLISRLFPNARVIHTFRDPIDTCLSCFSINFTSQPFAHDLGELGRYYRAYAIMMRHWKRVLPPGMVMDVRYEAVVQDLEPSARAIVAHCGLEWDDACLRFYEADRPVRTASVEQVRRPIYQSSVGRWRPSEATLRPLIEGLGLSTAPR